MKQIPEGKKRDRIDMPFYREICEVAYKLFGFKNALSFEGANCKKMQPKGVH